jgi:dTMP kinase
MAKGHFIVCEGLDCSGKTACIRRSMEQLRDYPVIYSKGLMTDTPAGRLSMLYPSTLTLLTELAYLDERYIRPALGDGKIVLQDRWYYSVLSHNPESIVDDILERIFVPRLSGPDLLVNFSVSFEKRIERLKKNLEMNHRDLLENPEIIYRREKRYIEHFESFRGYKAMIDTTELSEEGCGYELFSVIDEYLKRNPPY